MATGKLPAVLRLSGPLDSCNLLYFRDLSDRIRRSLRSIRHEKAHLVKYQTGTPALLFTPAMMRKWLFFPEIIENGNGGDVYVRFSDTSSQWSSRPALARFSFQIVVDIVIAHTKRGFIRQ